MCDRFDLDQEKKLIIFLQHPVTTEVKNIEKDIDESIQALECIKKTKLDDALDVFAVHGVGGIIGALLTGVFAAEAIGGTPGLIEGNAGVLVANFISVIATIVYSLVVTLIILKLLDIIPGLGLRVSDRDEDEGLDISAHGERGVVSDGAD